MQPRLRDVGGFEFSRRSHIDEDEILIVPKSGRERAHADSLLRWRKICFHEMSI